MRTALIVFAVFALGCSLGCNTSSAPGTNAAPAPGPKPMAASVPTDETGKKLQELAGNGATSCGDVKTLNGDEISAASSCAMSAAKDKKPFYVKYDLPGMSVGIAGTSGGELFSVQTRQAAAAAPGTPAEIKSEPCPSTLRIAQSGRVTCFAPGSFGMSSSADAGNPHAGAMSMPPAGMANPHGDTFSKPAAGTPNPHAPAKPK